MPANDLSDKQRAFVETHLGVRFGAEGAEAGAVVSVTTMWREAKEAADAGISALQSAMKSSGIPAFMGLADHGLHAATEGRMSKLMAALMDADRAGDEASRGKARAAVAEMKSFLDTAKVITLMEKNPLGVAVSLRAPLGDALTRVDRALAEG